MGAGAFCEMSTEPHTVLSGWFGPIETYGMTRDATAYGRSSLAHSAADR